MATIDKVIWSDGKMTTINSEEATRKMYEAYTDDGPEWRIDIGDHSFEWHGNCWMEI